MVLLLVLAGIPHLCPVGRCDFALCGPEGRLLGDDQFELRLDRGVVVGVAGVQFAAVVVVVVVENAEVLARSAFGFLLLLVFVAVAVLGLGSEGGGLD